MITIKDIADYTGVSTTTVSNVIHGKTQKVSKANIDKIRAAIKEKGYVPRLGLETLSNRHTRLIMAVVHTTKHFSKTPVSDPFFGQIIGSIEQAVHKKNYYMMLYIDSDINKIFETALSWNVSGIITITFSYKNYEKLRSLAECPVVGIDTHLENEKQETMRGFHVQLDDYGAVTEMADYLIGSGFKNILTLTDYRLGSARSRHLAIRDTLRREGLSNSLALLVSPTGCLYLPDDDKKKCLLLRSILPLSGKNCALFCISDQLAFFVIRYLNAVGLKVPDDFSVAGFDDNPYAELSTPNLTTVRQNISSKGASAVELLFSCIENPSGPDRTILLSTTLIVRNSVRPVVRE